jgi:LPXTG-motif cell wall-anchored protein
MTTFSAALAIGAAAAMMLGTAAMPAAADTLPLPGCTTDCVATFDTVGNGDFDIPANISELTVTVAGGAGAVADHGFSNDPSFIGGAGGVSTIDLGTDWAGDTLYFGVGGEGGASYLQASGNQLLALAGGGGQAGYVGRFDLENQINTGYPGGAGASPIAPGITNGEDATAYGSDPANGLGGTTLGGAGGTGDVNGTAGGGLTLVGFNSTTPALGGAPASTTVNNVEFSAGRGGDGFRGGGGGAVVQYLVDENPVDLAAPGGGGAGFLAIGLTGVAGTPNVETGFVTFTYSLAAPAPAPVPAPAPGLPATGSHFSGVSVLTALVLLAFGGAAVVAVRRRRSA